MKILHCCLAAFYIDNYGYQENILPKMHKYQGHDVQIVASTETYIENKEIGYVKPSSYFTADKIPITRIPYTKLLPHSIVKKLRIYRGLFKILTSFQPDIIFLHNPQFISIIDIARYAKLHSVKIYVDSHTDFINSGKSWISLNILHKLIYKQCVRIIEPHTTKFYGTLPSRVDFLENVYNVPKNKLDLLVLGADDSIYNIGDKNSIRINTRKSLGINKNDFVIISGGKIDRRKNIHILLEAFNIINSKNIKLLLFGSISDDLRDEINSLLLNSRNVIMLDWVSTRRIYDLLFASDLGFFPGTHSVLWEQSVGVGLPCVFKKWEGIQHVDVGGNCLFLEKVTPQTILKIIKKIHDDKNLYQNMLEVAIKTGVHMFSYTSIAKYSIENK